MKKTIRTLAPEIMRGRISPVTLTEEVLQRAERLNPTINSFITILRDRALREAEAAEGAIREGKYSGPLHGIPIAMKDIFYIKGVRCTAGSKILATNVANYDSLVVKRLIGAGAVLIGTTNLHEFASGVTNVNPFYGPVRNPWDTDRVSGGSSGGSAAAVAAEMTVAALGTDTSGSVRIPSSLCGVVGLKPTYGRISRVGVIPLSTSFDTVGTLTSCAWDAAALLQELAGYENADMTTEEVGVPNYLSELEVPLETPRLGVLRPYFLDDIDPQVAEVFSKFLDRMSGGTVSISDVGVRKIEKVYEVWAAVRRSEATAFHEQWLSTMPEKYGEDVRKLLEKGREITAVQYISAQNSRPEINENLLEAMKDVDFLVAPTTPVLAPKIGEERVTLNGKSVDVYTALSRLTLPFNVVGFPVISIPIGYARGLPVGAQIVARPFEEGSLLRIASRCEELLGERQLPPLQAGKLK